MLTRTEKRNYLHEQQRGRCALCGKDMELSEVTLDHRYPRSRGGGDQLSNLQAAHGRCNSAKGSRIVPRVIPPEHLKDMSCNLKLDYPLLHPVVCKFLQSQFQHNPNKHQKYLLILPI